MKPVKTVNPETLYKWLKNKEAVLVDVREPAEYGTEKIKKSRNLPLSAVTVEDACKPEHQNKKLIFYCQSGRRSRLACEKLMMDNAPCEAWNLEGGILAWKSAGLPVTSSNSQVLLLSRQVQLTIGVAVVLGLAIGTFVSPYGYLLSLFAGLGLINSALTGWCGLTSLLKKMPWNQE